ncbi:MAG: DUF998 domain-containing protein, partial [Acidobacteriota bacterium]|nr:DUF998 domain-containing protein [Acidobacteriota bacterium]
MQALRLSAGFGGLLFVIAFLIIGAATPGYDSLHETISGLEFTRYGALQRANFLVFGILLFVFAEALRRQLRGGWTSIIIPLFQATSALGVTGDALFAGPPLHLICDLLAFNSALIVVFAFAFRFRGDPAWKGWAAYSAITGLLMMACLTAFGVLNHNGGCAGAMEKLATLTRTIWSAALVWKLLSQIGRQPSLSNFDASGFAAQSKSKKA